ncbi:MAG: hypothetical protein V4676_13075 [Bacteroidota bacterium]
MVNDKKSKNGTPINPSQRPQAPTTPNKTDQLREGDYRNADATEETSNSYEYDVEQDDSETTDDNKPG